MDMHIQDHDIPFLIPFLFIGIAIGTTTHPEPTRKTAARLTSDEPPCVC
jgi:hypothetical protein